MLFWSVGCFESKLPWSLTFVCFSSYDLVASPFAVVLCRVGNYYWESRCTMVAINLVGMVFVFPIFCIFLSPRCLPIVLLAFLTLVGLCCPLSAFVILRFSLSSFIVLWQPVLACVGLRWKRQFLIMFSTKNTESQRGGDGGQKAPNLLPKTTIIHATPVT